MTGSYITKSCIITSFFKISTANGNYTSDYSDLIREKAQKTTCLQPFLSSWSLISAFDETTNVAQSEIKTKPSRELLKILSSFVQTVATIFRPLDQDEREELRPSLHG